MSKRAAPSDRIYIDPLFQVPPGSEDVFVYSRDVNKDESPDDAVYELFVSNDEEIEEGEETDEDYDRLAAPHRPKLIKQTLRRADDGHLVVDVIIEVDDIQGQRHYEMQVTKPE